MKALLLTVIILLSCYSMTSVKSEPLHKVYDISITNQDTVNYFGRNIDLLILVENDSIPQDCVYVMASLKYHDRLLALHDEYITNSSGYALICFETASLDYLPDNTTITVEILVHDGLGCDSEELSVTLFKLPVKSGKSDQITPYYEIANFIMNNILSIIMAVLSGIAILMLVKAIRKRM